MARMSPSKKTVSTKKTVSQKKNATSTKSPARKAAPAKSKAISKKQVPVAKAATRKKATTTPKIVAKKAAAKVAPAQKAPALKTVQKAPVVAPVPAPVKADFAAGDMVVYPTHGVGRVEGIETLSIGGQEVCLVTVFFESDRLLLKLPIQKAKTAGLRRLSSRDRLRTALETLQGKARIRRTMWSRRAQEYETKINSGDPVCIAEVLRDLKRNATDNDQSYSERQIFQSALSRLAREVAAVEKIGESNAAEKLQQVLAKAA